MQNMKIRLYAKERGVPLWKVAAFLRISEPTLYRNLRQEIEDEQMYLNAVDKIREDEKEVALQDD